MAIKGSLSGFAIQDTGEGDNPYSSMFGGFSQRRVQQPKRKKLTDEQKRKIQDYNKKIDERTAKRNAELSNPLNVFSDIGKAFFSQYERTGKGFAEIANDVTGGNAREAKRQAKEDKSDIETIKFYGEQLRNAKNPKEKARIRKNFASFMARGQGQFRDRQQRTSELIDTTDPVKNTASLGLVGLDVVTGGTGSKALNATRTTERVVKDVFNGASLGAIYGVLGTAEDTGKDGKWQDYAINTGVGAILS